MWDSGGQIRVCCEPGPLQLHVQFVFWEWSLDCSAAVRHTFSMDKTISCQPSRLKSLAWLWPWVWSPYLSLRTNLFRLLHYRWRWQQQPSRSVLLPFSCNSCVRKQHCLMCFDFLLDTHRVSAITFQHFTFTWVVHAGGAVLWCTSLTAYMFSRYDVAWQWDKSRLYLGCVHRTFCEFTMHDFQSGTFSKTWPDSLIYTRNKGTTSDCVPEKGVVSGVHVHSEKVIYGTNNVHSEEVSMARTVVRFLVYSGFRLFT